jgi:sugar transferase (PEP-CTERM/EpsH1 system associated)
MKLLAVVPYLPSPTWGGGARSFYVLRMLARTYRVSLVALTTENGPEQQLAPLDLRELVEAIQLIPRAQRRSRRWEQIFNFIQGRSTLIRDHQAPRLQAVVDSYLADGSYDAVYFDCALTAGLRIPEHVTTLVLQHNIEYELLQRSYLYEHNLFRKWYNWREYRLVKPFELACCRRADVVFVASEREQRLLQDLLPRNLIGVVPNGVDLDFFDPAVDGQEMPNRLVFTGSMDYYPNVHAVLFFARACWPYIRRHVPEAEWLIVGRNPPAAVRRLARLPGVTVTGSVPDIRSYLAEASVVVVPLRIGSGTRLKILEAFAMRKAVISTALGAEGLAVTPGEHLLIEDQPEAFARAVIALLRDEQRRRRLGEAGRRLVEQAYSWSRCEEALLALLARVEEHRRQRYSSARLP